MIDIKNIKPISNVMLNRIKKLDNKLIKLIKAQKADMFTPAPILGYYLGKLSEIKVVRTLLTCKKNGVAPEEIRKRIRETYA